MSEVDGKGFDRVASATADGLTNAMILHPIACGVAFIAFLLSVGAGVVGSLLGAAVAALAWLITLVVMVIDFVLFGVSRHWFPDVIGMSHLLTCLARSSRITSTPMARAPTRTSPSACGPSSLP